MGSRWRPWLCSLGAERAGKITTNNGGKTHEEKQKKLIRPAVGSGYGTGADRHRMGSGGGTHRHVQFGTYHYEKTLLDDFDIQEVPIKKETSNSKKKNTIKYEKITLEDILNDDEF